MGSPRELLRTISEHVALYCDPDTGLAYVDNGTTGQRFTPHDCIDTTGSVAGMVKAGRWHRDDRTASLDGTIHNIDQRFHDPDSALAAEACRCAGCMEVRG